MNTKFKSKRLGIILVIVILILITVGFKLSGIDTEIATEPQSQEKLDFYITNKDDINKLLNDGKPSFLFFGSKGCSACIPVKANADKIYEQRDDISIGYIEVTEYPELLEVYDIQQTPSVLIFNENGDPYKFKRKDASLLNIYYKKSGKFNIDYTVFLGIPATKTFQEAMEIMSK